MIYFGIGPDGEFKTAVDFDHLDHLHCYFVFMSTSKLIHQGPFVSTQSIRNILTAVVRKISISLNTLNIQEKSRTILKSDMFKKFVTKFLNQLQLAVLLSKSSRTITQLMTNLFLQNYYCNIQSTHYERPCLEQGLHNCI